MTDRPSEPRIRFATIAFRTTDVARLSAFYREVFGFDLNERWGDGDRYRPGKTFAELHAADPDHDEPEIEFLDEAVHVLPPGPRDGRPGPILAFRTDDIRAAIAALEARGLPASSEVIEEPWGWCCYLRDPDGNDLELFQYRD
jgi:catechol 2,3-dioxygenase-like lactoylglutathione lyase family enzyme